jgi:hypothetical protein
LSAAALHKDPEFYRLCGFSRVRRDDGLVLSIDADVNRVITNGIAAESTGVEKQATPKLEVG